MNNEALSRYAAKLAHAQGILEIVNENEHSDALRAAIDDVFLVRNALEHEVVGFDGTYITSYDNTELQNIEEPISADRVFEILEKERPL